MTLLTPKLDAGKVAEDAPPAAVFRAWWLASLLLALCLAAPWQNARAQPPQDPPVLLIDIKGAIGCVAAAHLAKAA